MKEIDQESVFREANRQKWNWLWQTWENDSHNIFKQTPW